MGRGPMWTEADLAYLEKHYGTKSNLTIAKHLKRGVGGIKYMATKLGLGNRKIYGDKITAYQLYRALHNGNNPPQPRLEAFCKKGFPIHVYRLSSKYPEKETIMIDIDEFWSWLEKNQDRISILGLEENLLGKEPAWAKLKRKKEWLRKREKRWAT